MNLFYISISLFQVPKNTMQNEKLIYSVIIQNFIFMFWFYDFVIEIVVGSNSFDILEQLLNPKLGPFNLSKVYIIDATNTYSLWKKMETVKIIAIDCFNPKTWTEREEKNGIFPRTSGKDHWSSYKSSLKFVMTCLPQC